MENRRFMTVRAREPLLRWLHSAPGDMTIALYEVREAASAGSFAGYQYEDERQRLLSQDCSRSSGLCARV